MLDVIDVMDRVPEIFLRVPSTGETTTSYGLRPSINAMSREEVLRLINRQARIENFMFYAVIIVVLNALFVVAIATIPYLGTLF